jgi:hypothetical protein
LKPKVPMWVKFGRPCNERCWHFYGHFVYVTAKWYICNGHLVHFVVIWYILLSFGIFSPIWYVWAKKIWQPCFRVLSNDFFRQKFLILLPNHGRERNAGAVSSPRSWDRMRQNLKWLSYKC